MERREQKWNSCFIISKKHFAKQVILWQGKVSPHLPTRWLRPGQFTRPVRFQVTLSLSLPTIHHFMNNLTSHHSSCLPTLSQFSFISHVFFHEPLYLFWCPSVSTTGPGTPTSRWVSRGVSRKEMYILDSVTLGLSRASYQNDQHSVARYWGLSYIPMPPSIFSTLKLHYVPILSLVKSKKCLQLTHNFPLGVKKFSQRKAQ